MQRDVAAERLAQCRKRQSDRPFTMSTATAALESAPLANQSSVPTNEPVNGTERRAGIGVQPAGARYPAAGLGEAEHDGKEEQRGDDVRRSARSSPCSAATTRGKPEDARTDGGVHRRERERAYADQSLKRPLVGAGAGGGLPRGRQPYGTRARARTSSVTRSRNAPTVSTSCFLPAPRTRSARLSLSASRCPTTAM